MKNNPNNWHAWNNLQPPKPSPGGTLHVVGDLILIPEKVAFFVKAVPQGINPQILILDVVIADRGQLKPNASGQLHYVELLSKEDQYSQVQIRQEGADDYLIEEIEQVQ